MIAPPTNPWLPFFASVAPFFQKNIEKACNGFIKIYFSPAKLALGKVSNSPILKSSTKHGAT